jgi:carboxyl-terminal processing protease
MNKYLSGFVLIVALFGQSESYSAQLAPAPLTFQPRQAQAALISAEILTRFNYAAKPLDSAMSATIFDHYLKSLDPERLFFIESDINQMSFNRLNLSEGILRLDLSIPFGIFNLYSRKASERFSYARTLLTEVKDFSQNENYQLKREDQAWPKSERALDELWRKRVKNEWLRLKLAGEPDANIIKLLDKRYANALAAINTIKSDEAFERFMNAYTMSIDPHTNYMGPDAAENFDVAMSQSLVGIGASMSEHGGANIIGELIPGGPALRSGKLNVGDRIIGVAQGEGKEMIAVQGLRKEKIVAMIRGEENTTVVLEIIPAGAGPDGKHERISLQRKKIKLEEQVAKKTILSVDDGAIHRRIGVITLPLFYRDFNSEIHGNLHFKSASSDVLQLLEELKTEKVDGVLVDLRDNGGGSLTEAIELTGLFTGKGPVLQQRDARGIVFVNASKREQAVWNGPLGVLINRNSASASEIFAAAIQDYGRGVVIGERSFGKGTVQSTFNLDDMVSHSAPELGELKMTVAQFFRIDGGTTQLRGVTPDIALLDSIDSTGWGEATFDNALPWDKIAAANFTPQKATRALIPVMAKRSEDRIKANAEFMSFRKELAQFALKQKNNLISLNEDKRRAQREPRLEATVPSSLAKVSDDGLEPNERTAAAEKIALNRQKNQDKLFLNEAAHIISDEVNLQRPSATVEVNPAAAHVAGTTATEIAVTASGASGKTTMTQEKSGSQPVKRIAGGDL